MKQAGFKPRKRKCPVCGGSYMPFNSMQKCCAKPSCALQTGKAIREKSFRAETLRRKAKLKTKSEHLKDAQAAFNAFVRMRDMNKPCISCGRYHGGKYDAGHYRTVGAAGHLRFNLFNCHRQCVPCNQHKSGNVVEYRINLVKRIGVERVERIENNNNEKRYTIEYAKRIKRIFTNRKRIYEKLFRCT